MKFATRLLVVGFVHFILVFTAAQSQDPDRCIDKVSVWMVGPTDTFFAPLCQSTAKKT